MHITSCTENTPYQIIYLELTYNQSQRNNRMKQNAERVNDKITERLTWKEEL